MLIAPIAIANSTIKQIKTSPTWMYRAMVVIRSKGTVTKMSNSIYERLRLPSARSQASSAARPVREGPRRIEGVPCDRLRRRRDSIARSPRSHFGPACVTPSLRSLSVAPISETSCRLLFGLAVDLVARRAQARLAVAIEIPFPGQKFIDGDVVENTGLIDRHPATAHGFDDGGLAPHGPSLAGARQFRYSQKRGRVPRIDLHLSLPFQKPRGRSRRSRPERRAVARHAVITETVDGNYLGFAAV